MDIDISERKKERKKDRKQKKKKTELTARFKLVGLQSTGRKVN